MTPSQLAFSTFQEVARKRAGRPVALFGAGNIAEKTARRLSDTPAVIFDNNPNLWNTRQLGTDVLDPAALSGDAAGAHFVLICTTSFSEVAEQLAGFGLTAGEDFLVSPILNDLRVISDLESIKKRMLFTSGGPAAESQTFGGGIYELVLDETWTHRKVVDGTTHGLIRYRDGFLAAHHQMGVIQLDTDLQIVSTGEIPAASRPHGVAFAESTGMIYVAASYLDRVLVFDQDLKMVDQLLLSNKLDLEGAPAHHCNDLCVVGSSLYVSMFSYTGNWKREIFDGVVLEIDLSTGRTRGPVIQDLWMPHNVAVCGGELVVLDSLRGQLKKNNALAVGEFPAFSRGLAWDGAYFYIGQSRNRNYTRSLGISKNISIDTGIVIFDESTKVSRTLQLPSKLSEIHAIVLLD